MYLGVSKLNEQFGGADAEFIRRGLDLVVVVVIIIILHVSTSSLSQ